jgi:cytochrome c6
MKTRRCLLVFTGLLFAGAVYAADAKANFEEHCTKCHGTDGKGQTKTGRKLGIRDFTDPKVQIELKDADMLEAITNGIRSNTGKEMMKEFKDELSAEEIRDLAAYMRSFKA